MNLYDVAAALNLEKPLYNFPLTGICIDSRQVKPGNLFFAIRGERFDGHDFIDEAVSKGAAAVVCSRENVNPVFQLRVADTLKALADLACAHRRTLSCSIIALTGSNGKTTVKEMIASILPKPSFATPGNLNNHIGVPLSVLQINPTHRYGVLELGANHPGEIAHTVAIAKPKVTLINNIAPAHVEGFGSIEGVARAKGEIYQGLDSDGTAVINNDDDYRDFWNELLKGKKTLRFSRQSSEAIHARDIGFNDDGQACFKLVTPAGEASIQLQVAGMHNVSNALAAAACAHALDIPLADIAAGLCQFKGVSGRMTYRQGINQSLIIDDTYNANLRSVLSGLAVLAERKGRRIFVFGDMGELGEYTSAHHQEVGVEARRLGIDSMLTVGVHSELSSKAFGAGGKHYSSQSELVKELLPYLDCETTVLVKGSRSSAMEKIVQQIIG